MKLYIRIALFMLCTGIWAQSENKELANFQKSFSDFVSKKMKKHHVVGANVAVVIDNKVVVDEAFGFSDVKSGSKTTLDTKYPIGSVSKVVASTAVLKLYSDGRIDIDRPYTDYVPDFEMKKHFSGPIDFTVRHILSHYAGLPRLRAKGFLKKKPLPLDSLLSNSRNEYLIAPAGKVYQYSDWGVDLLALLVQRVTKMPYGEFVVSNVFDPLGMKHSGFGPVATKGYINGKETPTYEYSWPGSDGVYSTASDLGKLCQVYFDKKGSDHDYFLKPEVVKEALSLQFVDAPMAYNTQIGLMWEIQQFKGFKRVKKAGIHEPFYTYIFYIPEYGASVIVCSNSNASSRLHWEVWSKAFDFLSKKYGLKGSLPSIKRKSGKVILTSNQMKELGGTYGTDLGILNLEPAGKKFNVTLGIDEQRGIATPYADNLLKLSVKMMGIKIHAMDMFWDKIGDELIVGEQYESGRRNIGGSKISNAPIPESWKQAVGTFKVVNYDDVDYQTIDRAKLFINQYGILELRVHLLYPAETEFQLGLAPVSKTLAIIPGYNFDFFGGETIELIKGKNDYELKLSGYKLQRIQE
ncbi:MULTISPECIES: serine hydrolase domain-containing protein [Flavobacteriaceae]|uniref:serine hydrolase domain-containing protein n=1 Tax=Flavobacteriaceae TaxID=49546 RepID=UPI001492AB83|nr:MULTISPECIES: serine hydrolase domain-containing protein [Allomuricauda]MDC6366969.1 serine hydrolase [Muricauda sp. AC10]